MKEIVIVSKGNNAVAYGEGVEIKKSSTTGISANLQVLNELLKNHVPVEAGETFRIFLMDIIQGINSGYAIDYVKTGKQLDGKDLAKEDLTGYKEFYNLYKDRLLNIRFNQVAYIPKMRDNKSHMELRSKAYVILNQMPVGDIASSQATSQIIDPDKELRDTMTELMTNALKAGDMDTYKILKAERDELRVPQVVSIGSSNNAPIEQPKFETPEGESIDTDLDIALTGNNPETTNDKPIVFEIDTNKPSWDGEQANA